MPPGIRSTARARVVRAISGVAGLALAASTVFVAAVPAHAALPEAAWDDLETRLDSLIGDAEADGVRMAVTVDDLSGTYGGELLSTGSQEPYKAASIIKLPLLALLMDEADAGTLSLDELITIPAGDSNIVGGSGTLRNREFPLDISVRELMELMVQVSDNTATNVLIDRAGGFDAVNAYMAGLGFETLWLGRKMIHPATPPLGENWINADEVTELISMLYRHEILSASSSEHIIDLMKGQLVDTKFGAVIPREHLGNKTGELADVSHDSGIIFLDGREVSLTATTEFSSTRPRAEVDLYVQQAATIVYEFLQEPVDAPIPDPTIPVSDEWTELRDVVQPILDEATAAGVDLGVAVTDLSGYYDDRSLYLGKLDRYTTASTIKMALAATVMHQVQSGALSLDDVYTITEDERYGGSGVLLNTPFPQDVSVGTMLDLMITVSDNTATNKLVDVVGGFDPINTLTQSAGIGQGDLHFGRKMFGPIVPVYGDIWLTPYGVDQLMTLFYDLAEGDLVRPDLLTAESAQTIIDLMLQQEVKTKLGAVIPAEVLAHKTGENADVSHDIGVLLVDGQELTLSVFSTRQAGFTGDVQATANPFLQRIGAAVYAYVLETAPAAGTPGGGDGGGTGGGLPGTGDPDTGTDPAGTPRPDAALAATGAPVNGWLGLALLLSALGAAAVVLQRSRRLLLERRR
jgi:beta-lactamase class A